MTEDEFVAHLDEVEHWDCIRRARNLALPFELLKLALQFSLAPRGDFANPDNVVPGAVPRAGGRGEHKANPDILSVAVADETENRPLSAAELRDLQERLARLSEPSVQAVYRRAYHACRMDTDRLPSPRVIQELVQAWKQLWKWRR